VVIQNERGRHVSEGTYDRHLAGAATDRRDG
jgi:predicted acyl esterase